MMKHIRYCLLRVSSFAVLFCAIFSLVFVNPISVSASTIAATSTYTGTLRGYILRDSTNGGSLVFSGTTDLARILFYKPDGGLFVLNPQSYYRIYVKNMVYTRNIGVNGDILLDFTAEPYFLINGEKRYFAAYDNVFFKGWVSDSVKMGFDYRGNVSSYVTSSFTVTPQIEITSFDIELIELSDSEVADLKKQTEIADGIKHGNELQKESNETSKGILGKITDFFSSFFDNIINALKSLFIPEDGYFSDFFDRLNTLFSEKLGFLYAPIDLFLTFLNAIQNASVSASPGVTFPEVKWDDTVLIPETKVDFSLANERMPDLQEKIYFVTDIIMVGAVLILLERKIDEVMRR